MSLAQALEESTRYELKNQIKRPQTLFTESKSADVGLTLRIGCIKYGGLEKPPTFHISLCV